MKETSMHINCDMGESYGRYHLTDDRALMPYINACNIACGYHAGDPSTIRETILSAIEFQIEIGAHPGYPDLVGFGRRKMDLSTDDITDIMLYQVSALKGMTEALGGRLTHVKPHGALYNTATVHRNTSEGIAKAVAMISEDLIILCPPHSELSKAANSLGLKTKTEAFIDRRYNDDLTLSPRDMNGSVITDGSQAKEQAISIWRAQSIITINNNSRRLAAETLCIHGDNPAAIDILKEIRGVL